MCTVDDYTSSLLTGDSNRSFPVKLQSHKHGCRYYSPVKCELRDVIRFLQVERNGEAEIHRRMSQVYGNTCMSDDIVCK